VTFGPSWRGVDETVVERFAAAGGRSPAASPLAQGGDLPLFLFLMAGLLAGGVLGYTARALFAERGAAPGPGA
jgi:hypothetical protein